MILTSNTDLSLTHTLVVMASNAWQYIYRAVLDIETVNVSLTSQSTIHSLTIQSESKWDALSESNTDNFAHFLGPSCMTSSHCMHSVFAAVSHNGNELVIQIKRRTHLLSVHCSS